MDPASQLRLLTQICAAGNVAGTAGQPRILPKAVFLPNVNATAVTTNVSVPGASATVNGNISSPPIIYPTLSCCGVRV